MAINEKKPSPANCLGTRLFVELLYPLNTNFTVGVTLC
jgi:hypothetical protein